MMDVFKQQEETEMTYIILKDTLGNGLTTFNSSELELYSKDQLEEGYPNRKVIAVIRK